MREWCNCPKRAKVYWEASKFPVHRTWISSYTVLNNLKKSRKDV